MQAVQDNSSENALNESASRRPLTSSEFGFTKAGYTVEEALPLLPFGRTTLWEFISSGELPVMRFGRRVSIATGDLTDLLNKRRGTFTPHQSNAA